jgi:hypothetical protein
MVGDCEIGVPSAETPRPWGKDMPSATTPVKTSEDLSASNAKAVT